MSVKPDFDEDGDVMFHCNWDKAECLPLYRDPRDRDLYLERFGNRWKASCSKSSFATWHIIDVSDFLSVSSLMYRSASCFLSYACILSRRVLSSVISTMQEILC